MTIEHVEATEKPEHIAEILRRDGCCVVDGIVPHKRLDRVREELGPWLEQTSPGRDGFSGKRTRRTGALIARSPEARELIEHPLVLGSVKALLDDSTNFQLHLTQIIAIGPDETAQDIHRDQWAFDFFPFPNGYEVQCNTLWAMTDFTEKNGATRVVPGSNHFEDKLRLGQDDTEPAEMEAGSALIYTGALYHGGGANRSDHTRYGLNITYARAWLRQEENQYLSVPQEVAKELPESLQRLMGYSRGAYALGYVDDLRDPIEILRPDRGQAGLGDLPLAETLERPGPHRVRRS
jgi:hypothetical protein